MLVPLAAMEFDDAVMVDVVGSAAVVMNVTVSLSVIPVPLIVPVMVAVPDDDDEVNVAV